MAQKKSLVDVIKAMKAQMPEGKMPKNGLYVAVLDDSVVVLSDEDGEKVSFEVHLPDKIIWLEGQELNVDVLAVEDATNALSDLSGEGGTPDGEGR